MNRSRLTLADLLHLARIRLGTRAPNTREFTLNSDYAHDLLIPRPWERAPWPTRRHPLNPVDPHDGALPEVREGTVPGGESRSVRVMGVRRGRGKR